MDKKSDINLTNLAREIQIIELDKVLEEDRKFAYILHNASDKLKDFILLNKITTFSMLQQKLSSLECERKAIDEVIETCTKQRGNAQDPLEYIQETSESLFALGASEKSIIKVLSYNVWPKGPDELKENMLKTETLKDFKNMVQNNMLKMKQNKKKSKTQKAI